MVLWIPLAAAGIAAAGGIISSALNAREARKNREFQERMSSTAHQREVADLRAAGINPAFRSMGGASAPPGDRAEIEDVVGKGVSTALAAKQMQANIDLTKAQAEKLRMESASINMEWEAGKWDRLVSEKEISQMSAEQKRMELGFLRRQLEADIQQRVSSAEAARARAALDRAALTGALNVQQFEERVGELGPILRNYLMLIRSITPLARIPQ